MFGSVTTSVGLAEDLQKGLIERFRALPMARSAVLGGRTSADLVRNIFVVVLITVVGFLVGFRIGDQRGHVPAGGGLVLLFAYALSWGFAIIGLSAPNSETAQLMAFPILFPLTFASSAFVPVATMPGWLQGFAANQPVSIVIDAARSLMVGGTYTNHRRRSAGAGLVGRPAGRAGPTGRVALPPHRLSRPGFPQERPGRPPGALRSPPGGPARRADRRWGPGPGRWCRGRAR